MVATRRLALVAVPARAVLQSVTLALERAAVQEQAAAGHGLHLVCLVRRKHGLSVALPLCPFSVILKERGKLIRVMVVWGV